MTIDDRSAAVATLVLRGWLLRGFWAPLYGILLATLAVSGLSSRDGWGVAFGVIALVCAVVASVRSVRAAFIVDSFGITIRNVLYTKRCAWPEIGEVGWDHVAVMSSRGGIVGISVCVLGDPYAYASSATVGLNRMRVAAQLAAILEAHGVENRVLDRDMATDRWWLDPRSKHH